MHAFEKSTLAEDVSWTYYAVAFSIALLALLPRFGIHPIEPGIYLWAEDGSVFLNEAREMGLATIFHPYAGYLHLYPRIFTAIAQLFSLADQPAVLLAGWLISYLILIYAVVRAAVRTNRSLMSLCVLLGLISLQPNYVEVFFNITNSQWMIGAALFIFALVEAEGSDTRKKIKGLLLAPMALTGPFSIVLTPVLLLRMLIKKDWATQKYIYIPIFLGALVQTCILLSSERMGRVSNNDPWQWLLTFSSMMLFGANSIALVLVSLAVWFLLAFQVSARLREKNAEPAHRALLMLMAAIVLLMAGIYAKKHASAEIMAIEGGNRYTWVPYALILLAGFILTEGRKLAAPVLTLLAGVLCITGFHKFKTHDLQFEAFEKFARVEQVYIPINPMWPEFPAWHVLGRPQKAAIPPQAVIELDLTRLKSEGLSRSFSSTGLALISTGDRPKLLFSQKATCPNSKFAGLDIYLTRGQEGWMELFWDENGSFSERASIPRWYPAGELKAQFAFPMPPDGVYLRFDPMRVAGHATISKVALHCL